MAHLTHALLFGKVFVHLLTLELGIGKNNLHILIPRVTGGYSLESVLFGIIKYFR